MEKSLEFSLEKGIDETDKKSRSEDKLLLRSEDGKRRNEAAKFLFGGNA